MGKKLAPAQVFFKTFLGEGVANKDCARLPPPPPGGKHGGKMRIGRLTPAFSGAQKRAALLGNPCTRGGTQRQARG